MADEKQVKNNFRKIQDTMHPRSEGGPPYK